MRQLRSIASSKPPTSSGPDESAVERATIPVPTSTPRESHPQPVSARDSLLGTTLDGRYRIEQRIGKGGMGVVYRAEHLLIGRKVAIKTLQASAFADDDAIERFRREARAAVAAGSDHVVDVTDMGQVPGGAQYLVLEYLDGIELAAAVAATGQLPIARAIDIVAQLCDALSAVHLAGIVHRDLKPENVFLIERDGRPDFVKVLDFGVCKMLEHATGGRQLTATGAALGTPHFMAPEQVEGSPDIDQRADVYAVGAILFFALSGNEPLDAPSLPLLFVRICETPPPLLCTLRPEIPLELANVVARALAKRPEQRFQSCAELKAALLPFAAHAAAAVGSFAAHVRPEMPAAAVDARAERVRGHRIWLARVVLALALCLAGLALVKLFAPDSARPSKSLAVSRTRHEQKNASSAASSLPAAIEVPDGPAAESAKAFTAAAPVMPPRKVRSRPTTAAISDNETTPREPERAAAAPEAVEAQVSRPAALGETPAPRTIKHVF